jgi:hypothetical protein
MAAVFDVKKEIPVNGFLFMSRESEIGFRAVVGGWFA